MRTSLSKSKKLIPISEAAEVLDVSIDTIRRWDKKGVLHSERNGKNRYFSLDELENIKFQQPLSISEASKRLKISSSTLRRLENKGFITPDRNQAGERVYSRESLEKFLNSEYFLRQKSVEEKILEPLKEEGEASIMQTKHRILGAVQEDLKEDVTSLNLFRKIFFVSGLFLTITFMMLVLIITYFFLVYPEDTAKYLGYEIRQPKSTNILGATYSQEPQKGEVLGVKILKPISQVSLGLVKQVSPETYQKIVPTVPIKDVNDIFGIDENGNIAPQYNFKVPDSSYLQVPDSGLVENLNAEFLNGKTFEDIEGLADQTGLTEIKSSSSRLTVTQLKDISTLTLDLTGITADISKDSVKSEHIKNGEIKGEDIAGDTIGAGQLSSALTFSDGDFINLSAIVHDDSAVQGLRLPNASSSSPSSPSTGEGYIAWDSDGNQLILYNGLTWATVSGSGSGDITAVVAGTGLSGGATSGSATLTIDQSFTPTWTGEHTFSANINANGGFDVDDAFVIADGGKVSTIDISDTDIALTGASTTFTATGALTFNTGGTITIGDGGDAITLNAAGTLTIQDAVIALSSQATDLDIIDNTASALTISEGSNNYFLITTTNDAEVFTIDLPAGGATSQTMNFGISNIAKTINIGTGTAVDTVNIGTGATNANSINIGTGSVANTIAIGSSSSTTVSITDDHWSVTAAGLATFAGNVNANGGFDVDDAFVIADGGAVSTLSISDTSVPLTGASFEFDFNNASDRTFSIVNAGAGTANFSVDGTISQGGSTLAATYAPISSDFITVAANSTLTGETAIGALSSAISTTSTLNVDSTSTLNATTLDANAAFTFTSGTGSLVMTNAVTNASDKIIDITPSFTGGATDALTYAVIDAAGFTADNGAGTDTVQGIVLGNLTESGAGAITSRGVNLGSGWDVNLLLNDTTSFIQVADTGNITIEDSAGNDILLLQDIGGSSAHVLTGDSDTGFTLSGITTITASSLTTLTTGSSDLTIGTSDVNFTATGGSSGDADVDVDGYLQVNGAAEFDSTIQLDGAATFNSTIAGNSDITVTLASTEDVDFSIDPGADTALTGFQIDFGAEDTTGTGDQNQYAFYVNNLSSGTDVDEVADALILLENNDADDPVNDGIAFGAGGAGTDFSDGIDFSAANLTREIVLENGEAIIGQTADTITFEDDDGTDYATLTVTTLDITGALQSGSSNVAVTLATGFIDADALTLTAAADAGTGTSSGSGLIARSDGIGLLQGCTDTQILKWVESTDTWDCGDDGGSTAWNAIGDAAANGAIAFGSTVQTMDWGTMDANASYFTFNFTNAGTSAGTDNGVVINNAVAGSATDTTTETLLLIQQLDTTTTGTTVVSNGILIDSAASSAMTDGIEITNSAGNLTNGINIVDTSGGTLTTGIVMAGTFTNYIDTPNFDVSNAGAVTLGAGSSSTGSIVLNNSTNNNTVTLQAGVTSGSYTWTLPTADSSGCLASNGSGTLAIGTCGDIQKEVISSTSTWTKPTDGVILTLVELWGSGGGGGGGTGGDTTAVRYGGGGGGGGAYNTLSMAASELGSTVEVTVGAAGAGGAGGSSAVGTAGDNGNPSCFSTATGCAGTIYISAYGGGKGAAAGTTAGNGGGGGGGISGAGSGGGATSGAGGAGGDPGNTSANNVNIGFGGGGGKTAAANPNGGGGGAANGGAGGGGTTTAGANTSGTGGSSMHGGSGGGAGGDCAITTCTERAGGAGGKSGTTTAAGGGTGGAADGGAGGNGSAGVGFGGDGGGGGGSQASGTGGAGGAGGTQGGGGGGGGAGETTTGGAGGAGGAGEVRVWTIKGTGADLAEIYSTNDDTIGAGSVVALDSTLTAGVKKTDKAYDVNAIGIISTSPSLVMGSLEDAGKKPVMVALAGRVPVKVSLENGPIKPGDFLTPSSTPGVAMKATKSGQIVGQAMIGFQGVPDTDSANFGVIVAFVKNQVSNGSKLADLLPGLTSTADLPTLALTQLVTQKDQLITSNLSEITTDRVTAGLELITPKVIADEGIFGTITVDRLKANQIEGLEIFTDKIVSLSEQVAGVATASAGLSTSEEPKLTSEVLRSDSSDGVQFGNVSFESATVQLDLVVLGKLTSEGSLVVLGSSEFKGETVFERLVTFLSNVIFRGKVTFEETPTFNKDTAGFAVIAKGSDKVEVVFEKEYAQTPLVNITITLDPSDTLGTGDLEVQEALERKVLDSDIRYIVNKNTAKGFTIKLNKNISEDIRFSWTALAVKDAKTVMSAEPVVSSNQVTEPSPSPTTVIQSPSPTPEATNSASLN